MSSNPIGTSTAGTPATVSPSKTDKGQGSGNVSIRYSEAAISLQVNAQANVQILQQSLQVSFSSGEKSQQLVFKAAIDKINEYLKPTLGDNAIQNASQQDNSPEATAKRIVDLSTGLFSAYKAQNPGLSDEDVAAKFNTVLRKGVEDGFNEAKDILKGLDVLKGDVASNIDKTYGLVQKGLDDFFAKYQKPAQKTGQDPATPAA